MEKMINVTGILAISCVCIAGLNTQIGELYIQQIQSQGFSYSDIYPN